MRLGQIALAAVALGGAASGMVAAHVAAAGQPERASVAIVELFTSEGCSSCPPADALLRQIHLKQTSAGQLVIGLSEHVTYWNSLGWRDPYSDQVFTDRQNAYAQKMSLDSSYTPQMVLNGRDQFVGSNTAALQQALRADSLRKHADLKILASTRDAGGLQVTFSLSGSPAAAVDIIAALTDDVAQSNVLRGENSGRALQHVSVARSLARVVTVRGDTPLQAVHLKLPREFPQAGGPGHHLVLFAQEPHQGAIVGAATVAL